MATYDFQRRDPGNAVQEPRQLRPRVSQRCPASGTQARGSDGQNQGFRAGVHRQARKWQNTAAASGLVVSVGRGFFRSRAWRVLAFMWSAVSVLTWKRSSQGQKDPPALSRGKGSLLKMAEWNSADYEHFIQTAPCFADNRASDSPHFDRLCLVAGEAGSELALSVPALVGLSSAFGWAGVGCSHIAVTAKTEIGGGDNRKTRRTSRFASTVPTKCMARNNAIALTAGLLSKKAGRTRQGRRACVFHSSKAHRLSVMCPGGSLQSKDPSIEALQFQVMGTRRAIINTWSLVMLGG